mgnify:CR=1 FL=1
MVQKCASKVFDNKFMCGVGESARFRLSSRWAMAALDLVCDRMDAGLGVTAQQFAQDFCRPLKASDQWHKQMLSQYKDAAKTSGSFQILACSVV